jgi:hypothetical protein
MRTQSGKSVILPMLKLWLALAVLALLALGVLWAAGLVHG